MKSTWLALSLVLVLSGCATIDWFRCGDNGCPEYIYCPVEKKRVVASRMSADFSTDCVTYECGGWGKCQECTTTATCSNGHTWTEKHKVRVP